MSFAFSMLQLAFGVLLGGSKEIIGPNM
jgi:hypothetical protein